MFVGELTYDLEGFDRVIVIGAGKSAAPMAQAVEDRILGWKYISPIFNDYLFNLIMQLFFNSTRR